MKRINFYKFHFFQSSNQLITSSHSSFFIFNSQSVQFKYFKFAFLLLLASCRFGEPSITIVVESIPPFNTSKTAIYMAGNFNDWNPKDEEYRLNWLGGEKFGMEFKIPKNFTDSLIEYKYTRGSWDKVEVNTRRKRYCESETSQPKEINYRTRQNRKLGQAKSRIHGFAHSKSLERSDGNSPTPDNQKSLGLLAFRLCGF